MEDIKHIHKEITESPDSIALGSASKEGILKIYGDFSNLEAFKKKIDNALAVRSYFQEKAGGDNV